MAPRLLLLASPELHGPDVRDAQLELRRHGDAVRVDGRYGAATAAAVRRLQRAAGLRVDGIVGPHTRAVLAMEAPPRQPAMLPGREPPGLLALAWMLERVGLKEEPAGSNHCPITVEFGIGNVPWCMETVSLGFKHGANLILGETTPAPWGFWPGRGFAYVPAFEAWAKTRGYWTGRVSHPEPGDVACFDWNGDGVADHVGLVKRDLGYGNIETVEGNTAIGNDSNGGEILHRDDRHVLETIGFARIRWQQS